MVQPHPKNQTTSVMPWLLLLLLHFTPGYSISFTEEPRLEATDGNLWIVAAQDRNITLATSSRGVINVNGQDLQAVVEAARAAARDSASRQETMSTVENLIRRLESEMTDVKERLAACESQNANTSLVPSTSSSPYMGYQVIATRLALLDRNLRYDECSKNPCKHGGKCLDLFMKFSCICPDGWEGKRCQRDANECALLIGTDLGCQNGATCVNKPGTYECICTRGYFGRHCTKQNNNCSSGSVEMCDHGVCVPYSGFIGLHWATSNFKCICDQGWTKVPGQESCSVDVDECAVAPCSKTPKVNCINIPGSFRCESCPSGYTGNGHSCDDINECMVNNGDCSISPLVSCINIVGSNKCGPCPPGYIGDGKSCNFVGRCRADNGGCHPQATCQEIGTGVACACISGFTGSGIGIYGCTPTSIIAPNNGHPCSTSPCINGRCIVISQFNYTCDCYAGYAGYRCELPRNPCLASPCQNGGTCLPRGATFRCKCPKSHTGRFCDSERYDCGGLLAADEGLLDFPSIANTTYRPNLSCAWEIRVNTSMAVNLTFDSFDLQSAGLDDCTADWLQIYDGKEFGDNNRIGKFCGSGLPNNGSILSTGNTLLLWFKSDLTSNFRGFKLRWTASSPICGGELNATVHGSFTSPGSPGRYPPSRDCYWTITTDYSQRITFTFFQLSIESHDNCNSDYLEFFDGSNTDNPLITRFCTSGSPAPVTSPGNAVYIHFHSDGISSDRGFQIAYHPTPGIPGCGGLYSDRSGQISSLNSGGVYKDNLDCVWLIRAQPDLRIKLSFSYLVLESSHNCRHDFIEIRYGANGNAPLAGKFCGTLVPAPILSTSNEMFVRFRTDSSVQLRGFVLNYEELCTKMFVDPTGLIKSPNYPNMYPNKADCSYLISQPTGKAIVLDFLDFHLEESLRYCYHDYVQVFDGMDERSPLKGRFCGLKRPNQIISSNNKLFLKFHSDISVNNRGWAANYSTIDIACGGILDTLTGTISSPTTGTTYLHDLSCQWVIYAPPTKVIQITFLTFTLEGSDYADHCSFDYLAIYNAATSSDISKLMGKFCGSKTPPPLVSSGNVMFLKFVTDSSRGLDGFQISYNVINASSLCGGNYYFQSGVIRSPNYPNFYPDNKICTWIIRVPPGRQIKLATKFFRLEDSDDCSYDTVEIRNGGQENSPLIGKYCGTGRPPVITSFSNQLFLRFTSDSLRTSIGFEMTWDSAITGCGGIITSSSGSITSPNYPDAYGHNALCYYRIRTSMGTKISMIFVDVELEDSENCISDFIQVFDGNNQNAKSLAKQCTNSGADAIVSSTNQLFVKFSSDFAVSGKGFLINYKTQCNVTVTGQRGVIENPNYPDPFNPGLVCIWTIQPDLGHTVNLTFTEFSFLQSDCETSFIEVKEGEQGKPSTNLLGKYCTGNNTLPPSIISSSLQSVTISLISTRDTKGTFRIEWVSVGCGETFNKPRGVFTSPNYPNFYPNLTHCVWKINVDPDRSIRLNIFDINMEPSKDCRSDALQVFGGPDLSSPLLTKFCGFDQHHVTLDSSGNQLTVVFFSDISNSGKGFSANFESIASKCGGVQKSLTGTIHTRNYPDNFEIHDDCTWTIRVDAQHRVNFTFDDFDLPDINCTESFVEIYDGATIGSQSLLKACGNRMPDIKSVVSTGNFLSVRFKSGLPYATKGFKASYFMTCGAVILVDSPGTISLNEAVTTSKDVTHCTWTLISPEPDAHITAAVTAIDLNMLSSTDPCQIAYLDVLDGDNKNATKLGQACGATIPLPFVSSGNALFLNYISPWHHQSSLSVAYSSVTSACGGEYYGVLGSFASPGYPGSYPPNIECLWILKSAPGNLLQMALDLKIPVNDNCNTEYIEIRRESGTGELLGLLCETNTKSFTSSTGFWIKFSSGQKPIDSATVPNFKAEYSLLPFNELVGPSGQIASPLYPRAYLQALENGIRWRITVSYAKRIKFTFDDLLMNSHCDGRVSIYDGFDETAVETQFCKVMSPEPFTSSSNVAFVKLTNRMFNAGVKFLLHWQEVTESNFIPTIEETPRMCGEDFYLSPGNQSITIKSPPELPNNNMNIDCEWIIRAPEGYHLGYRFLKLHFHATSLCHLDYVETYDGDSPKPIKKYCLQNETQNRDVAVEVGQTLRVVFHSIFFTARRDFELQVDLDQGGFIQAPNGLIDFGWNGSNFRWWIQKKTSHEWTIKVREGRRVRVVFQDFDVAAALDGTCKEKYVMLRNGHHSDSPFLGVGKYCGTVVTPIPVTSSEYLFVKITTPWRTSSFKLRFEEVGYSCGGRLNLPVNIQQIQIRTPNYPNSPHPKIQCTWIIQGPVGRTLHVDFNDRFDFKYTDQFCSGEYVEVFDGSSPLSASMGRFCQRPPSTLKTTDNIVLIKYFTNVTDPNNGFHAAISLDSCSGVIRSTNGVLTSPGYPVLPQGIDCTWKIQTNPYQQLVIEFVEFDLPPNTNTSRSRSEGLDFYLLRENNCSAENSVIIKPPDVSLNRYLFRGERLRPLNVFCTNSPPIAITTAGNSITVRLIVGQFPFPLYKGFKLKFSTIAAECGGVLATPDGVISSPFYPRELPRPYYCIWTVRVPPGRRITVRMLDFDLAGNNMEQRLYLYETSMRSEIATLHKLSPPKDEYKSSGNTLKVSYQAVAFSGTAHRGFRLSYSSNEAAECGGYVNSTSGIIEPPQNKTKFYCEWIFPDRYEQNSSLVFSLENARLGNVSYSACNYQQAVGLMIYVDENPSKFKSQLCGNVTDHTIVSPFGNVKVKSAQSVSFSPVSFRLRYRVSDCGGVITASMLPYTITTPGYSDEIPKYPSNTDCAWRIDTDIGQTLKISVIDFQLEKTCRDSLFIYNGGDMGSPLIDLYCGVSMPERNSIVSQDESLYMVFHSDESTEGRGFKILIENNHTDCGGVLFNVDTDLRSPGFPNKYDPNVECEWELRSSPGSHIGLVFQNRFHLETSDGCVNDFVKVYDYDFNNAKWDEIKTLCGRDMPAAVNSTSSRMRVLFRSNNAISGDGFRAVWNSNCGGFLNNTHGRVRSPGYPSVYPPGQYCEYVIAGNGQLITVDFQLFTLENSAGCKFDYIEIIEMGDQTTSHGKYCGTDGPKPIAFKNDVKIIFRTDGTANHPGFIFEYTIEKCGGEITENTVIKYSLGGSVVPVLCNWHIHDPVKNMAAAVKFTNVNLLSQEQCEWMSLKVMTRITPSNDSYKTLSRFCGKPDSVLSFTGKELMVVLNQYVKYYGKSIFTASVTFSYGEDQGCGGKLIVGSNPETLVSPDVDRDGFYEEFLECHWLIEAPEDHYLTLKILSLDLKLCQETNSSECCDFIEVRDGFGQYSDLILKTCGNNTPEAVVSSSNQMWLRMSTDDLDSGKGFVIQFSSQLSQCGQRNFEMGNKTGVLNSPGFPDGYPAGVRCSWTITAPQLENLAHQYIPLPIHIHIVSWDFEDSQDCTGDYLSIEDYGNRAFRGTPDSSLDVGSGGLIYHGSGSSSQYLYAAIKRTSGKTKYCGKGEGLDFYATSKTVIVEMVTNRANSGKGFSLEYSTTVCSRNYTRNQGRIRLNAYGGTDKCIMRITAPTKNHTISLYFISFALPTDCTASYLEVRDGATATDNSILKTCGYNRPPPLYSTGPELYLELYNITRYIELDITYTTTDQGQGCGGEIFNYGGTFTSPQYPQYIRENRVCRWDVSVPVSHIIAFKFQNLDLGPASTCSTDFIEFLYADKSSGDLIVERKFCGGDMVGTIVGQTNSMVVRYTRSVHNAGTGWVLQFAGVLPGFAVETWGTNHPATPPPPAAAHFSSASNHDNSIPYKLIANFIRY